MKKLIASVLCVLAIFSFRALGQGTYSGLLEYAFPILRSVPPVDTTMPRAIGTDYLWLDEAFGANRTSTPMDTFLQNLGYDDTSKFIASIEYAVNDYNPIKFHQWASASPIPYPYCADPGKERVKFESIMWTLAGDSGKTGFLLASDIIADVKVTDTLVNIVPTDHMEPKTVVVTCEILHGIKGQYIPGCQDDLVHRDGKHLTQSIPDRVNPVQALLGACMQFEYAPNWNRVATNPDDDTPPVLTLTDSTGDWV